MLKETQENRTGLLDAFSALRASVASPEVFTPKGGRPPRLPLPDIVSALAWHVLQSGGTFSENLTQLLGVRMAESSLSERRQSLGTQPWIDTLDVFLKSQPCLRKRPGIAYHGFRLVGVDGTTFNVGNTPTIKATVKKTRTRRAKAAFFRLSCVALCELGSHRPLSVMIGEKSEAESVLAAQIVEKLAPDDLLIADRYYGSGKWAGRLSSIPGKPRYLLRVQERFGSIHVKWLKDGSRLVQIIDSQTGELILVREIRGKVRRPGRGWTRVRLWTNLLDEKTYPSKDLIRLYSLRWEQEIAFREIKMHVHEENILASHTIPTAVQEICAMFMAQAIVIAARIAASAGQDISMLRISFQKTLTACRNLCWLRAVAGDEIGEQTMESISRKVQRELVWQASRNRRKRSCPRKVRQPIKKWPRLTKNTYSRGEFEYRIRKA